MADIRTTNKGRKVDIDLIRMKWELEMKEVNGSNIDREKDINGKRRRADSSKINEMLANQEIVRQKLKEQKKAKEDQEDIEDKKEEVAEAKDKPDVVGRRIIKK